jgi:Holliday junction DNA helicase RuvA
MIAYLEGKLVEKNPTNIVIDVNGVGYWVNIPLSSYDRLAEVGFSAKVLTYQYVREDTLQLYGFSTEKEKKLFELLLSVNGIGPKMGLAILSCIAVEDFQKSILEEDIDILTNISGIGKKTAQRLIVELKEKISKIDLGTGGKYPWGKPATSLEEEAILALVSLGYSKVEAKKSVDNAKKGVDESIDLEELVKRALLCTK